MYNIGIAARTRKSCFFDATVAAGATAFTVYNHMLMPLWYESPIIDYWYLMNNVSMWDVAVERQVALKGPDAFKLAQLMTPRNISKQKVGQGKYVPIVDENGGMLNDPILLRLADDHFWLSLADSDILLWAKGIAYGRGLDVTITEPDVSPLAIQGPNADAVIVDLLGEWATHLKFFWFKEYDLDGIPLVVAKSGWSKQGGYELYLRDGSKGIELWDRVAQAGAKHGIEPGAPSTIERIESSLLSYGNDMTIDHNPFEIGLGRYCDVDQPADFIGKAALQKVRDNGITQKLVGIFIDHAEPLGNTHWWPLSHNGAPAGNATSVTYSPRLERNIALAIIPIAQTAPGTQLMVDSDVGRLACTVTTIPFL